MGPDEISVKPGYPAAKTNLQNTVDGFTPPEGQRPADLTAAMDSATASGTPSLARVIELLKAVAASAAEDHAAGVATLNSGMATVNSWATTVTSIDGSGAEAVVTGDGGLATPGLSDGLLGVPETGPAESPAAPNPPQFESVPGLDGSPKRLGK